MRWREKQKASCFSHSLALLSSNVDDPSLPTPSQLAAEAPPHPYFSSVPDKFARTHSIIGRTEASVEGSESGFRVCVTYHRVNSQGVLNDPLCPPQNIILQYPHRSPISQAQYCKQPFFTWRLSSSR